MGGYVIYIDGFIDLAKARSRKMARAWGWSDISSGEFSSYTQVYADLRHFMPCILDGSQDPKLAELRKNLANEWKSSS